MLKDEKPIPFKLQLSPSDIMRYDIKEVDFTVARFDLGTLHQNHLIFQVKFKHLGINFSAFLKQILPAAAAAEHR